MRGGAIGAGRGHDQDARATAGTDQVRQCCQAIDARHFEVQEDDVDALVFKDLVRGSGTACLPHHIDIVEFAQKA